MPGRPGQHLEKRYFDVGNLGYPVWQAFGGFIGMCICNDRRWPEVYRVMGLQGVEIIFIGYNTPVGLGDPYEVDALAPFHNHLCMQAGAYQNATWVVGVAKAGCEEGFNMIGQSCVIAPSGEIVAMCSSLGDELIVHKCDLDAGRPYKADIFNFAAHRQPETYSLIVERAGAMAQGCATDAMKARSNSPPNERAVGRTVYLAGDFVVEADAKVSVFDRGLLFADSVYEGLGVLDGRIIEFAAHMARLRRSLGELFIPEPMSQDGFFAVLMALVERNQVKEGFLYLHITRGTADRDYLYAPDMTPTVFAFSQDQVQQPADLPPRAIRLQSAPDLRWARRDIKTSNLLGQVMAKQAARLAGADKALMVGADGFVTEGGATSFFTVKDGVIVARPVSNEILHGITRQSMLKIAEAEGLRIEIRKITLDETYAADEAFLTGASSYVEPVGTIDGHTIGNGQPGPVTVKLRTEYLRFARSTFYEPR